MLSFKAEIGARPAIIDTLACPMLNWYVVCLTSDLPSSQMGNTSFSLHDRAGDRTSSK